MINAAALGRFLIHQARGQGKTHMLAMALQKVNGTLFVRSKEEAQRVSEIYGINAVSVHTDGDRLRGRRFGITFIDPDAAGEVIFCLLRTQDALKEHINELKKELERIK